MKILLLEDELMLNNSITEYLKDIGHMVESFTDGQDVLDNVNNSYDLLILDINTPTKDGFEILTELNARKIYIPTIFISALIDIEDITKAYDLGCREYIKKPFHLGELGIKINQILKKEQSNTSHIRFSEN
jgi:DNA-binding response OmpR family regulator